MLSANYKNLIAENVDLKVLEYIELLDVKESWEDIVIVYTPADNEEFMNLYECQKCQHPKSLYTPGKTVISHFTPISEELLEQHQNGKMTEEQWEKLCKDTRQVSRAITDAIVLTLQDFGREVALLSERDGWSHLCGAEVAGIGKFEYKEDMFYLESQVGSLGSVITELVLD